MQVFFVYALRFEKAGHRFDGLVRYVGYSIKPAARFVDHCKSNFAIGSAIKAHGRDSFSVELLSAHESQVAAKVSEVTAIASFDTLRRTKSHGLNLTTGGDGGVWAEGVAERHRAAVIKSLKGAAVRDAIGARHRGKVVSAEQKAKQSAAMKLNARRDGFFERASKASREALARPDVKAKMRAANLGRAMSDDARAKMSATRCGRPGRPHTDAARAKIKEARAKQVTTPETRAKMSATHRARWAAINAAKLVRPDYSVTPNF